MAGNKNPKTRFAKGHRHYARKTELEELKEIKKNIVTKVKEKNKSASDIVKQAEKIKSGFIDLVANNTDNFDEWVERTAIERPDKALELVLKVSEFFIPKLQRDEVVVVSKSQSVDYSKLTDAELELYLSLSEKCKVEIEPSQNNSEPILIDDIQDEDDYIIKEEANDNDGF